MILETFLVLLLYKDISFGNKGKFKKKILRNKGKFGLNRVVEGIQ